MSFKYFFWKFATEEYLVDFTLKLARNKCNNWIVFMASWRKQFMFLTFDQYSLRELEVTSVLLSWNTDLNIAKIAIFFQGHIWKFESKISIQMYCIPKGHYTLRDLASKGTFFIFWVPLHTPDSPLSVFPLINKKNVESVCRAVWIDFRRYVWCQIWAINTNIGFCFQNLCLHYVKYFDWIFQKYCLKILNSDKKRCQDTSTNTLQ